MLQFKNNNNNNCRDLLPSARIFLQLWFSVNCESSAQWSCTSTAKSLHFPVCCRQSRAKCWAPLLQPPCSPPGKPEAHGDPNEGWSKGQNCWAGKSPTSLLSIPLGKVRQQAWLSKAGPLFLCLLVSSQEPTHHLTASPEKIQIGL